MINNAGKGLSVLLVSETGQDWQTFATWYSIYRNLPYAKTAIVCHRNGQTPFAYYQWTKRLKVPTLRCEPFSDNAKLNVLNAVDLALKQDLIDEIVLVMRPLTMAIDALDQKTLTMLQKADRIIGDEMWFLRQQPVQEMIDRYYLEDETLSNTEEQLYIEAKESDSLHCLVSYKKGCGRWLNTSIGCPFSSAGGLVSTEMTVNEFKVNEMWQKMVPLYNAVV